MFMLFPFLVGLPALLYVKRAMQLSYMQISEQLRKLPTINEKQRILPDKIFIHNLPKTKTMFNRLFATRGQFHVHRTASSCFCPLAWEAA
jgi:hypothetical protein